MAIELKKDFTGVVYSPRREEVYGNGGGVLYPRPIELHHAGEDNGLVLAAFDHYTVKEPPVTPIYASRDGGKTWEFYSQVEDTKNGYGLRFQPVLLELDRDVADLPAGTLVFSANSIPLTFEVTELLFFISRDHGRTWEYRSTVCAGGPPVEQNWDALGPVWEPFLYLNADGDITVIYTDERPHTDRRLNQTLALQVSKDGGLTWGEEKFVTAVPDGFSRPGMAIVTRLPDGQYFVCYECVNFKDSMFPPCEVHFKLSPDGVDWGNPADLGPVAQTEDGFYLGSMPYCLWIPQGGPDGTIILSSKKDSGPVGLREPGWFLVNYDLARGPWEKVPMLVTYDSRMHQAGWSMGMCTVEDGKRLLQLCPSQMDTRMLQISYGLADILEK